MRVRTGRMRADGMRRREFVAGLAMAAAMPPFASAQQTRPLIGYLSARSPAESANLLAAFQRGLADNGIVEDRNLAIDYRWALGAYDRLPAMAAELVNRPVAVLV